MLYPMMSLTNGEDKMIRFNGSINTKRWSIDALKQVEAHTLHSWISTSLQQLSCFSTVKSRNNHWHRWAPVTGHSNRVLCGRSPARFDGRNFRGSPATCRLSKMCFLVKTVKTCKNCLSETLPTNPSVVCLVATYLRANTKHLTLPEAFSKHWIHNCGKFMKILACLKSSGRGPAGHCSSHTKPWHTKNLGQSESKS